MEMKRLAVGWSAKLRAASSTIRGTERGSALCSDSSRIRLAAAYPLPAGTGRVRRLPIVSCRTNESVERRFWQATLSAHGNDSPPLATLRFWSFTTRLSFPVTARTRSDRHRAEDGDEICSWWPTLPPHDMRSSDAFQPCGDAGWPPSRAGRHQVLDQESDRKQNARHGAVKRSL
jgi:hypothetical protein